MTKKGDCEEINNWVNLSPETREGYSISSRMKEVWAVQLDMFRKLIDVCTQHGLRCWCDGGTLLGAVRHHGFIPWDDDIDVCMPRPDYDRLQELAPKVFQKPYFFQTAKTDKHYYRAHAQLRCDGTAAIRPSDSFRPFHQGIFIDIFALEGIPADRQQVADVVKWANHRMKCLKAIDYPILTSGRIGLVFRKMSWKLKVRKEGFYNLFSPIEDAYRQCSWDEAEYVAQLGIDGCRFPFPKHIFDTTLWMPFEQTEVPVPVGYDEFLRIQYGDDYMTPVQAPTNHGGLILDTTTSYQDLLPQVRKDYRKSQLRRLIGR